jgi:hypothetical protein
LIGDPLTIHREIWEAGEIGALRRDARAQPSQISLISL